MSQVTSIRPARPDRPSTQSVLRGTSNGWLAAYASTTLLALWSAHAAPPALFMILKSVPVLVLLAYVTRSRSRVLSKRTVTVATVALAFAVVAGAVIVVDFHLGTLLWFGTHASMIAVMGGARLRSAREAVAALPSLVMVLVMLSLLLPRLES